MKKTNDTRKRKPPTKAVSQPAKLSIRKLPTGVRGLDDILGGGIPEFSFNVIAAAPGCGKTTLAHQIAFSNATDQKPALYFTVHGEPAMKMLRYQQQFSFFDESKVGKAVRFINLGDLASETDLKAVLEEIVKEVTAVNPGIVVVDSFRTVMRKAVETNSVDVAALLHDPRTPGGVIAKAAKEIGDSLGATALVAFRWKSSFSASPSFSPAGKRRPSWSANTARKRSAVIRCSPSPMASSGSPRWRSETPSCESCRS